MSVVVRTIVIYFVVLFAVRLMGKRELAQLSPFDFVVAIIIAELAALPMEEKNIPLWEVLIPLGVVVCLEIVISYIALKSDRARGWIYGFPTVVIAKGKILDSNMRKLRYNTDDLLAQLRDKGVMNVCDVDYAIVEVPGTLSVILNAYKRSVTPEDLKLSPSADEPAVPVILDGIIHHANLQEVGFSENALMKELSEKGLNVSEIFMATFSASGGFRIVSKKGEPLPSSLRFLER